MSPATPITLQEGHHQAQALLLPRPEGGPKPAPWVAVGGGKGGVGKTLLAVNLAVLSVQAGYRTLLVDLDPGLGNIDVQMRLAPRHTLDDLVDQRCSPAEAIVQGPGGVAVLTGRSGSRTLASGDMDRIQKTLDAVTRAGAGYDLVLCDTGAGIGPAVIETHRRARLVLLVTTPDPTAVTDCYALLKILTQSGIKTPALAVNRVRSREEAMRTAGRLATVCQKYLSVQPPLLGWLRYEAAIETSILNQRPIILTATGKASEDLHALAASIHSVLPGLRRSLPRRKTAFCPTGT